VTTSFGGPAGGINGGGAQPGGGTGAARAFGGTGFAPPTAATGIPSTNGNNAGSDGAGGASPSSLGRGGFLDATTPGSALVALLQSNAGHYTWVAATIDSNSAAGYQLATGDPIMAIGGFNGTDPVPTLAQFQAYVKQGKIHYFISGGSGLGGGGGGSSAQSSSIASWVRSHFTAKTVDGVTVYDLTQPQTTGG
jgi:hypothetical protein